MNYHKYFQFIYLIIAVLFIGDAISKYRNKEVYWTSLLLAGCGIFMFFFKRNFAKKFDNYKKK